MDFRPERRAPGQTPDMKGITQDEISKLTKAMKNKEFRDHIDEYTREVSDPAHRQEYLDYLAQIEAKGEMPEGQQLLRCQPGLCVKTNIGFKNGQKQKCFINIVHCDRLEDLSFTPAEKGGQQVHLPYSLAPPRPDRDLKDEYCMTCDFAVSTGTFMRASQSSQILKMLIDTAADGLSKQFLKGHEEVSKDYKVMQRMQCKGGAPMPMSVRAELLKDKGTKSTVPKLKPGADAVTPSELKEMRKNAKQRKKMSGGPEAENDDEAEAAAKEKAAKAKAEEPVPGRIRVPTHRLVHSGNIDLTDFMEVGGRQNPNTVTTIPRLLKLFVELPTVKKSSDINMEVTKDNVVVEVDGKFYLDLPLPYEIEDANGSAKFDKAKQTLTLELPVVPKLPDPEAVAAAKRLQGLGSFNDDNDGALSEGGGSEDELPPLEDPAEEEKKVETQTETKQTSIEAPTEVEEKKRELLELEPQGSSLRVATQPAQEEPQDTALRDGVQELQEEEEEPGGEDLPKFLPAQSFEGAKAGYYFGTGDEGLGYYKDLRQKRTRLAPKPAPTPTLPSGPLVVEVEEKPTQTLLTLPPYAQQYVDVTASLSLRLPPKETDVVAEESVPLAGHLSRQNLVLRIGVPSEDGEVADLRLSLVGRRLTLSFCSRPTEGGSSAPSRWRRHCLRRTLCGAVDPRQWHAELIDTPGAGTSRASTPQKEVQVVLRKAMQREVWEAAFVGGAQPGGSSGASTAVSEVSAEAIGAEAVALGLVAEPEPGEDAGAASADGRGAVAEEPVIVEDSAELDVADPVVHDTAAKAEGPAAAPRSAVNPEASAAMVQSAIVMGQSVLLQNRLMYQLL